ncbi:MAG: thiamine pyrophosphate-dependent enzyme [Eubacterium sp.]|nr:thiamine pyrophosphate-dependent enzyme [Eubacterium sp.]MCH4046996.1 thiamine pyrophosphate-dependent enzyme [Eubacterium sp.]MCH4080093.1 thiamine pyrophosphate-dependent enzyme [Eubacterium sp.]MCI1306725.1 thiamine pyrophosphate-dependent enzyme [Eubacterium sp.]MCI1405199.1 thiamine pyrophosphate-dependent enzyme [Eubacterium sp.]
MKELATKKGKYTKEQIIGFYTTMVRIRSFENHAADCFTKGMLAGNIHLSIGQEAAEAGAFAALEKRDYFCTTHRGHGHAIARGADPKKAMAELFGKATGYCKGKGGSMHITDIEGLGALGANGIVGAGQGISAGSALASKLMGDDSVTMGCFGDSSTNQGIFHECLNMAATWKLPLVWFIENNGYGVSTAIDRVTNTPNLSCRAAAYNAQGVTVDGTDVIEVYEAVKKAIDWARSGKGPYVVEAKVYRYQGHYCGDPANYRPKEYMEEALKKDPIDKVSKLAIELGATQEELDAIQAAADKEMDEAVEYADKSPYPSTDTLLTDVYASDNERCVAR